MKLPRGSPRQTRLGRGWAAVASAALAVGALSSVGRSADIQWQDTTDNWNTPADWAGGVQPGGGDNAIVNNGGNPVTTSDTTVNDIRAGDGTGNTGTITMTGGNVTLNAWMRIGSNSNGGGTGTFNISGGNLTNNGRTNIAEANGSVGTMNVSGGTLTLKDAFVLAFSNGPPETFDSTGTVNQTGGTINNTGGWFSVGQSGTGVYNLSGGSLNVAGDFNISDVGTSKGTLNLSGTGSATGKNVFIGKTANCVGLVNQTGGTFTISPGGFMKMATVAGSTGTYTLAGGVFDGGGNAITHGPGTFAFNFTGGTMQNVSSTDFPLTQGGGTLHAGPAEGFGSTSLPGYTQAAGATLLADLKSDGSNADVLKVAGDVTLAGLLKLHVPGGGQVANGTAFTILDGNVPLVGAFSNAAGGIVTADNGEAFKVVYNGGSDGNDVVVTALVPEPTGLALLGLASAGLLFRRRGRTVV